MICFLSRKRSLEESSSEIGSDNEPEEPLFPCSHFHLLAQCSAANTEKSKNIQEGMIVVVREKT